MVNLSGKCFKEVEFFIRRNNYLEVVLGFSERLLILFFIFRCICKWVLLVNVKVRGNFVLVILFWVR